MRREKALKAGALLVAACMTAALGGCSMFDYFDQVTPKKVTLVVIQPATEIEIGQSVQFYAESSEEVVIWEVEDEEIATVDDGLVTGVAEGEAIIYAYSGGATATCYLTVKKKAPKPVNPDPNDPDDPDDPDPNGPDDPPLPDPGDETAKAGYTLTWHDEFNGTSLDPTKWDYQLGVQDVYGSSTGPMYWGNSELQYYTNSADNVSVADGSLRITARKQAMDHGRTYTSGRIVTRDRFYQTYGYFEAKMKTPVGNGMWPAFWMLPQPTNNTSTDNVYTYWAASGEIDIMEAKGRLQNKVDTTVHYGGTWPNNTYSTHTTTLRSNTDEWHTYAVDWTENYIDWYIDGDFVFRVTSDEYYSTAAPENPSAPFDQPFYMLLNFAIGGSYDPEGTNNIDPNFTSATMYVDYVRAYRKNG